MFVDSSAIVALLTAAPQADALANALEMARSPITSPIAVFEAVTGICRVRHSSVAEAQADVLALLEIAGIRSVAISSKETETALDAAGRYGVGSDHPAQLTTSQCFAYAISKNFKAPLLFSCDSFKHTDVLRAPA